MSDERPDWEQIARYAAAEYREALLEESRHAYQGELLKLQIDRCKANVAAAAPGVAEAKNETLRGIALDRAYSESPAYRELTESLASQNLARRSAAAVVAYCREQLANARAFGTLPQWSGFSDERGHPIAAVRGWPMTPNAGDLADREA